MNRNQSLLLSVVALSFIFLIPEATLCDDNFFDHSITEEVEESMSAQQAEYSWSSEAALDQTIQAVADIENLIISRFPGGAIFGGELLLPEDMRRVNALSDSMSNIINLCSYHPEALAVTAGHLNKLLATNHVEGLHLSVLGKALLLSGTPSDAGDVSRVDKMCRALNVPFIDGSSSLVADRRMILFEVSFLEINRDAFKEIGIDWPASTTLAAPESMRLGKVAPANSLEITIQHLVQEGKARIISRPRLACRSGQKATFQAGGEIPVPRTDKEGGISVTWKPYGIILQVAPTVDQEELIHVQVLSEVSMVDQANAVDGIPGILTRRVETSLSLSMGQWIVLSGLVHSDDSERIRKVPFLGDIPILGELFRSRDFQKSETELAVFLRPQPTEAADTIEHNVSMSGAIQ
jgi:pilus assembly protein CpaC